MAEISAHLASSASLDAHLGIGQGERRFLNKHAGYRYRPASIPKRRGGVRTLLVPEDRLKHLQRQLLLLLEELYVPRAPVHGFVKNKSAISNAGAHQGRPFMLNIDLEDFFGSVSANRVRGVLRSVGLTHDVASAIASLTVVNNQLPQGAPTSPILANMVSYRLDRELMMFAANHRLRYTRYADDITLSGYAFPAGLFATPPATTGRAALEHLSTELRQIVEGNGFRINPAKVWYADRTSRREVTGLVVNEFTNVRRTFVRNVRAALYRTRILGAEAASAEFSARFGPDASLENVLRGRLEWLSQVRGRSFPPYRKYAADFNGLFPARPLIIEPTHEEVAREAVYVIEFGKGSETAFAQGTAFFLEGVGLVTAHHVLKHLADGGWAELFRPHKRTQVYRARFGSMRCDRRDLAILEHNVPEAEQVHLKLGAVPQRGREPIMALGFPAFSPADELGVRPGNIVGRTTRSGVKFLEVDAILTGGLSGGPIVNERYEVLGVVHRGGGDQSKQLAVDVAEVTGLLAEHQAPAT